MNSYKQSLYTGLVRIAANVIMLGAIFFAMYQAFHWTSWPSEAVFCFLFFGVSIPVWIAAILINRRIRRLYPAEAESLVDLPHVGKKLVKWQVRPQPECLVHINSQPCSFSK